MTRIHPKLIKSLVEQTPRAMIAMLIVSSAYFWIFSKFVPFIILLVWFIFQILLAIYRFYNAKMFTKYLEEENEVKIKRNEIHFIISNVFQAFMWTISSILSIIYAPEPFELVNFIMIIGIITAAVLSMSSLYKAYLVFFFSMIIPQIIIILYYGKDQHIALFILTIIYIPATILLSKAMYDSRINSIKVHDELEKSVEAFHKLSIIDNLTNIYNRRYFFDMSENLISIAKREQKKVSLIMLDIDYFKKINDTYGHQTGDFVLVQLVKEIKTTLRESDIFARVGGEEFTILLNDTSLAGASVIAEKIRIIVERKTFVYNITSINITVSMGISELNKENNSIADLYKESDKKLYEAKRNGRNRVVI